MPVGNCIAGWCWKSNRLLLWWISWSGGEDLSTQKELTSLMLRTYRNIASVPLEFGLRGWHHLQVRYGGKRLVNKNRGFVNYQRLGNPVTLFFRCCRIWKSNLRSYKKRSNLAKGIRCWARDIEKKLKEEVQPKILLPSEGRRVQLTKPVTSSVRPWLNFLKCWQNPSRAPRWWFWKTDGVWCGLIRRTDNSIMW